MRLLFLILLMVGVLTESFAQSRADRFFDRGDYLAALKLYQKDLESMGETKDGKSDQLKARVANCFFRLNDVVRSGQMYKNVDQNVLGAEDLSFYAMTLLRSGDYEQALGLVDLIESLGGDMAIVDQIRSSGEFAKEVAKVKPIYTATKMNVNFAGFSSGVTYYKGKGLILAAPGEGAATDSRGYKTTRLYNAVFSGTGGRLIPFADGLADKYHIGAVTFTKDFKRMYYTRTILKKDGTSILKLMTAVEENGKWGDIRELNINSDDYSCAHPCLYRDSLLFFVSDMPGGLGGKDIYVTNVRGAECGAVQNLGEPVNTMFDELFPFVDETGSLYFASNGHVGLGGLDVFVSRLGARGWSEPQNMGRPINSSMDDFGLVFLDSRCAEGYVSSNRGGTGYNDFLFALKFLPANDKVAPKAPVKSGSLIRYDDFASAGNKNTPPPVAVTLRDEKVVVAPQDMFTVDYRYAIQIGAFRNPVPRVYFDHMSNVKVCLGYDNVYRYMVGEYPEEALAQSDLQAVKRTYKDAFVIGVDSYVAEKKIQNDVRGDKITDDELLLIRLKNFDRMKKERVQPVIQTKKYLDKPKDEELRGTQGNKYTIVLMSADKVLDDSQFAGIDEIDVYAVGKGKYMYCAGSYSNIAAASAQLERIRQKGFANARVIKADGSDNLTQVKEEEPVRPVQPAAPRRNTQGLKELLNF